MKLDRRNPLRADLTRRTCDRTPLWKPLAWWVEGADDIHRGMLISVSERGLALLTDEDDAPEIGRRICLGSRSNPWPRGAQVVRVEPVTGTTARIAAEFEPEPVG